MFQTARRPDEVLTEIQLPRLPAGSGWAFQEFARRHGDYALMGVAAALTLDQDQRVCRVRLGFLSAGDGVVRGREAEAFLMGQLRSDGLISEAAQLAAEVDVDPLEDLHATAGYRRHLARVLTGRVLVESFERALASLEAEPDP